MAFVHRSRSKPGFGNEEAYNVYDKPLFKGTSQIYKPTTRKEEYDTQALVDNLQKGGDGKEGGGGRGGRPVQFEKEADPFGFAPGPAPATPGHMMRQASGEVASAAAATRSLTRYAPICPPLPPSLSLLPARSSPCFARGSPLMTHHANSYPCLSEPYAVERSYMLRILALAPPPLYRRQLAPSPSLSVPVFVSFSVFVCLCVIGGGGAPYLTGVGKHSAA